MLNYQLNMNTYFEIETKYLENCKLISKILNGEYIYTNDQIKLDVLSKLSNPTNNYKDIEICLNKAKILENNNILLCKYFASKISFGKVNYINIENIEEDILIILNLLSEELLQVYDILAKNIIISNDNSILLRVTGDMPIIILPYTTYVLSFYNINKISEDKNKKLVLDYLYYTLYNINNSMNIKINSMSCFKNIKDNYAIDKLYISELDINTIITDIPDTTYISDTNEIYALINFIIHNFNKLNLIHYNSKMPILLDDDKLKKLNYWKKYIVYVFSNYINRINICDIKINKKITRLINKNAYIIKEIIKFIIIVSAMPCLLDTEYTTILSYFYNFIEKKFNYKDLEQIINITNYIHNITTVGKSLYRFTLNNYHINVLNIISNFKKLCEEFLNNNINILDKLITNDKNSFAILNDSDIYQTQKYYLLNNTNKVNYIKTYYNLVQKVDNKQIIKSALNRITRSLRSLSGTNKRFSIILENEIFYFFLDDYYEGGIVILPYKTNYINLIKYILEETSEHTLHICINTFTKMQELLYQSKFLVENRYITFIYSDYFDTNFYNLNIDIQRLACKHIYLYYTHILNKYGFIVDSLQFIYNNGYNKVGKLLEHVIDIMFENNSDDVVYCLGYIIYNLNVDFELLDYIIQKLCNENIFNTIEFKYTLLKFIRMTNIINIKNEIYLYPYTLYNENINKYNSKYKNILLKIYKNPTLYDLFFNFKDVDNSVKIYFAF